MLPVSAPVTSNFVGRSTELTRLIELATTTRLTTVVGPGGVGKSRLVVEATRALRGSFPGGIELRSLTGLDAAASAERISARLEKDSPESVAVASTSGPMLVILDDCEQVGDGLRQFTSRLLAANDDVSIIVTSREPLGTNDERTLVLAPFDLPRSGDPNVRQSPAVALFFDRVAASGAIWEDSEPTLNAVVELCRRVDALPLAIELAAGRARAVAPLELLELMGNRLQVLRARSRGESDRHRSVRAAIDLSVTGLAEDSRALFQRLSVFRGPFDLASARAVAPAEMDPIDVVDVIAELVDRSLLVAAASVETSRFRMLELVREFAEDELTTVGRLVETRERLTALMVTQADEMVREGMVRWSQALISRIVSHNDNLIAAIEWCVDNDAEPGRAFRLFTPLLGGIHSSRSSDICAAGTRIVERWPTTVAPFRAETFGLLAIGMAMTRNAERARTYARIALDDSTATGIGRTYAHRAQMLAAISDGDVELALTHATSGRVEADRAGLHPFERELLAFEALLAHQAGIDEESSVALARAKLESDEAHDPTTEMWAHLVDATIAGREERWNDVRRIVSGAYALTRQLADGWWRGTIFRSSAFLAAYEAAATAMIDGWHASGELWTVAIEQAAASGETPELALTIGTAAITAMHLGEAETASALAAARPATPELFVLPPLFVVDPVTAARDRSAERPALARALRAALDALTEASTADGPDSMVAKATTASAARLVPTTPSSAVPPGSSESVANAIVREAGVWRVTFNRASTNVRDLKGIGDLAVLLGRPRTEVHCLELMGATDVGDTAGPVLDNRARSDYKQRILDLQSDIDEAHANNDSLRAARAEQELDVLVKQLSEAFGLGGRDRNGGSSVQRARSAVTYRVRAAIKQIATSDPVLGRHLDNSVRTGVWCSYHPETDVTWSISP